MAARPDFCALRTLVSYRSPNISEMHAKTDALEQASPASSAAGKSRTGQGTLSHAHYALNSRIGSTRDSAHDTDSTCTLDDTCELLAYDPRVDAARLPERRDIVARDRGEPASRELIARERIEDRA